MFNRIEMGLVVGVVVVSAGFMGCGEDTAPPGASDSISPPTTAPSTDHDLRSHATMPVINAPSDATATNTRCPVSRKGVDANGPKVVYKDQVYGFCCEDCLDTFKAEPEKFVAAP